jgi:hypothetical protein
MNDSESPQSKSSTSGDNDEDDGPLAGNDEFANTGESNAQENPLARQWSSQSSQSSQWSSQSIQMSTNLTI